MGGQQSIITITITIHTETRIKQNSSLINHVHVKSKDSRRGRRTSRKRTEWMQEKTAAIRVCLLFLFFGVCFCLFRCESKWYRMNTYTWSRQSLVVKNNNRAKCLKFESLKRSSLLLMSRLDQLTMQPEDGKRECSLGLVLFVLWFEEQMPKAHCHSACEPNS